MIRTTSKIACVLALGVLSVTTFSEERSLTTSEMQALGMPHYTWDGKYENVEYADPEVHARYLELLETNGIEFIDHHGSIYVPKEDLWAIQDQLANEIVGGKFGPPSDQPHSFPYDQGFPFEDERVARRFISYLSDRGVPYATNPSRNTTLVMWAPRDNQERELLKAKLTEYVQPQPDDGQR